MTYLIMRCKVRDAQAVRLTRQRLSTTQTFQLYEKLAIFSQLKLQHENFEKLNQCKYK